LTGCYRQHVQNFAELTKPLTNFTKELQFIWTNGHQKAFDELKRASSTEPLMIYPDFSQPYIAFDAST
jgi:hypothetical protein